MANPQRILCNSQNLLRTAALTPSSVEASDAIIPVAASRTGSASVVLEGPYTGNEDATVDLQIVDLTADTPRASSPILIGAGSGILDGISAVGIAAQSVKVQLKDAGIPIVSASVDFEGVKIVAATPGADGNNIHINVDQSGLTFTPSDFSLLTDLKAGQGGPTSGLVGPAFDWGAAVLGVDNIIPASAKRISFGDDKTVYLQYKRFVADAWNYFFVPALLRDIPADTRINIVTGGRVVTITDSTNSPATVETYTDVKTQYDLLHAVREGSDLVTIDGIVANDRSPTGQASRDLLVRTDAYALPSFGTGSRYATGVDDVFVAADAGTENVKLRCYAVTAKDHPLAHLGGERWVVKSVLSAALADAVTGVPYLTDRWGFTIPQRFPPGYGTVQHGDFSVASVNYAGRDTGHSEPAICPKLAPLGPNAVDDTITLTYEPRPSGNCDCSGMPAPRWREICLGIETTGGDDVTYSADARTRLSALYAFAITVNQTITSDGKRRERAAKTRTLSAAKHAGSQSGPEDVISADNTDDGDLSFLSPGDLYDVNLLEQDLPSGLVGLLDDYERAIIEIDALVAGADKDAGWAAWDDALDDLSGGHITLAALDAMPVDYYKLRLRNALAAAGISPLGKSDASILVSGDGCWQDYNEPRWAVAGSEGGGYAPAFTNRPYYSSRRAAADGKFYSTRQFALQINVKCPELLKFGDTVTLKISNASWPATYQVGDEITIPIVAAHDLYLAGGQDGTTVQLWSVSLSVLGPLPLYTLDTAAPSAYSSGGLTLLITQGGVPFKVGDEFQFAIEGGHFKWRLNGGAWSAPIAIPDGTVALVDGLAANFGSGQAPSFAIADTYSYRVLQQRRASNLQAPGPEVWKWASSSPALATLLFDLGSVQDIPNFAMALHTLPVGCTITLEGAATLDSPWAPAWTETLTRVEGPIVGEFTGRTARYLLLSIADADEAEIGYAFCGPSITPANTATFNLRRIWKILRGSAGIYQAGRYLGKAVSGELAWEGLSEAEVVSVQGFTDYVKTQGDEAFIVVPNITRPAEAFLGQIAADQIDWPDIAARNAGVDRQYPLSLPVSGVYFR